MRETDKIMKQYLSDNDRFADLINAFLGAPILSGSKLVEKDTRVTAKVHGDSKPELIERVRDIICKAGIGMKFVVMGIENQNEVDYGMPIRVMLYDAIGYDNGLDEIKKKNRKNKKKHQSRSEFLSGCRKEDRVQGVFTLVVYYDQEPWDGAVDLHGLIDLEEIPLPLRSLIHNYPINLLEVNKFKDIERFETDLKAVFGVLQNFQSKEGLREFVYKHEDEFSNIDRDTYDVITQLTGKKGFIEFKNKKENKEKEKLNMCKAIDDMIEEGEASGSIKERSRITKLIGAMVADGQSDKTAKLSNEKFLEEMLLKYNV